MTSSIENEVLDGEELDVVWNLTLVANIISANVEYGKIEEIESMDGVKEVLVETKYLPAVVDKEEAADSAMATSSSMIGDRFDCGMGGRLYRCGKQDRCHRYRYR